MEIKIDLENEIAKAVAAAIDPARISGVIQKQIEKTVDDAVNSAFSSYGDFSKTVSNAVKQLVPHELELDKQAEWNHFICHAINERVALFNDQRLKDVIMPTLDKLLCPPPETINLSDLVRSVVASWREYDDSVRSPYLYVKDSDVTTSVSTSRYKHIYIAKKKPYSDYSSDICLSVTGDGEVYSMKIGEEDVTKVKFAGPYFNAEQKLFQLYACKTKIVIDVTEIEDIDFETEDFDD